MTLFLAAAGVVLVVAVPSLLVGYAGALLWGLGIAIAFPLAMSAAGETPGRGPAAIAMVATGAATRVRLTGLREPDAVAGAALARAQAAHVAFELDRTELVVLTFGPAD